MRVPLLALGCLPFALAQSFFTELEDVSYSIIEYVPFVGTVYSLERASVAYSERDWKHHWQSVANFLESSVRDVVLVSGAAPPTEAALLHTFAESLTDKLVDSYAGNKPEVQVSKGLDRNKGHVVVAEGSKGQLKSKVFEGEAKGVHHFHNAKFKGRITNSLYAPNGEDIYLELPDGLYNGARVTFSWKWTHDADGAARRAETTWGVIRLTPGSPTRFGLSSRRGDGWEGYDFWGTINSKNEIRATTRIVGKETDITFTRVPGT